MSQHHQTDGIDNVVVTFDRADAAFKVGTPLTGTVTVICLDTTAVRGIRIKLFGQMKIHWRKIEGGSTYDFAELEDYLDEDVTVWVPSVARPEERWMFPGTYTYPFKFDVPVDLPDTLEDSRYGKVDYYAKATVYLSNQRMSHSLEETFYIIAVPDPSVPKPAEEDMPKENCAYAVLGGTCFKKKTHVELYLRLEKNHYKLGENIPVHVEIKSEGGSNEVKKVTALLVQEAIYKVNMDSKDEQRKKERLVVSEAVDEEDSEVGVSNSYDLSLPINDRMPLSDFPWCEFIEMGYFVHVVARTHSFYDDVVVKLPVIINPKDDDDDTVIDQADEEVVQDEDANEEEEEEEQNEEEEEEEEEEGTKEKSDEKDMDDLLHDLEE